MSAWCEGVGRPIERLYVDTPGFDSIACWAAPPGLL